MRYKEYAGIEINHLLDRLENIIEKDGRFGMMIGGITAREVISYFIKEEKVRCKNG